MFYRDDPDLDVNGVVVDFTDNNTTDSFRFKVDIKDQICNNGTKNVEKILPLKYLSNFYRILKMPLINCEINLMLTWSSKCVISSNAAADQEITFSITDTKLYITVVTLSTQDNTKLLQQLKSGFKCINIRNKYQSKVSRQIQNQYIDYLIDLCFHGVIKRFLL